MTILPEAINRTLDKQLARLTAAFPNQRTHICYCANGIEQAHWEAYSADAGYGHGASLTPEGAVDHLLAAEPQRAKKKRDQLQAEIAKLNASLESIEAELAAQKEKA